MKPTMFAVLTAVLIASSLVAAGSAHGHGCGSGYEYQCHNERICEQVWHPGDCTGGWGQPIPGRCGDALCCKEEKTGQTWHHHLKDFVAGHFEEDCHNELVCSCIAVSCPAIPCGEGYQCTDGQCILIPPTQEPTCPEVACDEGYHCAENQCTPDICGEDFQCDAGQECGPDNTCVPIPERSSGPTYFSNPYWDQIGGCDRALYEAVPTGSLPTTGNGDIVVKAISCIIDARGDKYGCTALDGMKLFYRANDDGVFTPTCAKRCYFGGCDSVTAMGGYPLTATAKNPQQELRAVVCKPYGDAYDVFTIQVTFEKPGMETVTMSTKDSCFDQTLGIGAYCGGCRASPSLAAIFNPNWIAPLDSPLWDTCRA